MTAPSKNRCGAKSEKWAIKGLACCGRLLRERKNIDDTAVLAAIGELNNAVDEGKKRVILCAADIFAGLIARAALANQNAAAIDDLAAKTLNAKPLSVGVASVYG